MKKTIVALLCFALFDTACFAGGGNRVDKLVGVWGNGQMKKCLPHSLTKSNACIGATPNCENKKIFARDRNSGEWAIQLMIALDINENGARFCPVQMEARSRTKKDSWTEYTELGSSYCVWLCKNGYAGDRCESSADETTTCDATELKAENFAKITRAASGANIEDRVPMFHWNWYDKCGGSKKDEHDMILAISRWTPSGHGAIVQQMIARSYRHGKKGPDSWPEIYSAPGAEEILLCKTGYKANSTKTDCEPVNKELCALSMACNGWADFDGAQHTLVLREGSNCYEYRCSKPGQAFHSSVNRTCVDCTENLRGGANPVTGECVKCDAGKIFNANASSSGYCSDTIAYSKTDMQYGKAQTRNTNTDVKNQCWIFSTPDEYIQCVKNGGASKTK